MPNQPDKSARVILPIPDLAHDGLTTYDAKDPDTKYPPINTLLPLEGAQNVFVASKAGASTQEVYQLALQLIQT